MNREVVENLAGSGAGIIVVLALIAGTHAEGEAATVGILLVGLAVAYGVIYVMRKARSNQ